MSHKVLSDSVLLSFPDPSRPSQTCWACSYPKCSRFYMLPGLCAHWLPGISFHSLSFTLSDLSQRAAPPRNSLGWPLYVLCPPWLFHEPCEVWNYGCFMVLAPELSNVWHMEITQVFMKWMNGFMSRWNDCLSDKFNWRFVEMMWTILITLWHFFLRVI